MSPKKTDARTTRARTLAPQHWSPGRCRWSHKELSRGPQEEAAIRKMETAEAGRDAGKRAPWGGRAVQPLGAAGWGFPQTSRRRTAVRASKPAPPRRPGRLGAGTQTHAGAWRRCSHQPKAETPEGLAAEEGTVGYYSAIKRSEGLVHAARWMDDPPKDPAE